MESTVLLSAKRTPIGSFQGKFSNVTAPQLGSQAIRAAVEESKVPAAEINFCVMGEVLAAGVGQAPARQAALGAGLSNSTSCMTINKVCGSGLQAIVLASDFIQLKKATFAVAGGQENMTLAPHLFQKSREGLRMGNGLLTDSMVHDGLWDPYNNFHMGTAAEMCVKEYSFTRTQQDEFAIDSYKKAQAAIARGDFKNEITPVTIAERKGPVVVGEDEEPGRALFDKIPTLKGAFQKDGTITAANASKINDGAAAVVLTSESEAKKRGLKPLARILGSATFSQAPEWFTTAPAGAIKKALSDLSLKASDIDLWEINEAFAVVAMAAVKEFEIPANRLNVHGGAIALGHPIGASGARLLTTLCSSLHLHKKRRGLATLCIGGGEAIAVVIESI